jgi:P27 family predicted phage terminase small subunit
MPACLSELAQEEWRAIMPTLERLGITTADGKALAIYCESWADWCRAKQDVDRNGIIIEEPVTDRKTGDVVGVRRKRNPAVSIRNEAAKLMKSYLIEFGLTLASRSKLRPQPPKPTAEEDEFEAYMAGVPRSAPAMN